MEMLKRAAPYVLVIVVFGIIWLISTLFGAAPGERCQREADCKGLAPICLKPPLRSTGVVIRTTYRNADAWGTCSSTCENDADCAPPLVCVDGESVSFVPGQASSLSPGDAIKVCARRE